MRTPFSTSYLVVDAEASIHSNGSWWERFADGADQGLDPVPYVTFASLLLTRDEWREPRSLHLYDGRSRPPAVQLSGRVRATGFERLRAATALLASLEGSLRAALGDGRRLDGLAYRSGHVSFSFEQLIDDGKTTFRRSMACDASGRLRTTEIWPSWVPSIPRPPRAIYRLVPEIRAGLAEILPASGSEL